MDQAEISKVGVVAAELMEFLADVEEADAEIGTVAVVVEIRGTASAEEFEETMGRPPREGDDLGYTAVRYRCSDGRTWVQRGLLSEALRVT